MEATSKEVALSQVACLLDELNGKAEITGTHWKGYHPAVYDRHVDGDALVQELCAKLQSIDVSKQSLEMQVWWRDHQKADKDRLAQELARLETEAAKQAALAKLTDHERRILGV